MFSANTFLHNSVLIDDVVLLCSRFLYVWFVYFLSIFSLQWHWCFSDLIYVEIINGVQLQKTAI